ncbi:hypothetical protein Hdeb2414_s0003g00085351 [Helianthus debilis subsp. tardiflorus]
MSGYRLHLATSFRSDLHLFVFCSINAYSSRSVHDLRSDAVVLWIDFWRFCRMPRVLTRDFDFFC